MTQEFELSRRDLLAAVTTVSVIGGSGCSVKSSANGIPIQPSPTWTANYNTHIEGKTDYDPSIVRTSSTLKYIGTQWSETGNPLTDDEFNNSDEIDATAVPASDQQGAWKHTFAISSLGVLLTEGPDGKWEVDPKGTDSGEKLSSRFLISGDSKDRALEKDDDFPRKTEDFILDENVAAGVSVSAARDSSLYRVFETSSFEKKIADADQKLKNAMANRPLGDRISRVTDIKTTNAAHVRAERVEEEEKFEEAEKMVGMASTSSSLMIVIIGTFISSPVIAIGSILTVIGAFATFTMTLIGEINEVRTTGPNAVPRHDNAEAIAGSTPSLGNAVGHAIQFDVYVSPGMEGEFTVRSKHRSELTGGDYIGADNVTAMWKVQLNRYPSPENVSSSELPPSDGTRITEPSKYPAQIKRASFNTKRRTRDDDGLVASITPRPNAGIAGPFSQLSAGKTYEYSADTTTLAGSHIDQFEWRSWFISKETWRDYQRALVKRNPPKDITRFIDRNDGSPSQGKFTKRSFDQIGRHVLELIVKDTNRQDADVSDDSILGVDRTTEMITVGGKPPSPKFSVKRTEDGDIMLDASETEDPDTDIENLHFDWFIVGPFKQKLLSPSTSIFGLFDLLTDVQIRELTGEQVILNNSLGRNGAYFVSLTVDAPFQWATTSSIVTQAAPNIVIEQGPDQYSVTPFKGTEPAQSFYDYSDAEAHPPLTLKSDHSHLLFYNDHEGVSLVIIHDKPDDGSGGMTEFKFSGLPSDGTWIEQDDPGDFARSSESKIRWKWVGAHTDGGIFKGGLNESFEIEIRPEFGSWLEEWEVLSNNPVEDSPRRIELDPNEPIVIRTT